MSYRSSLAFLRATTFYLGCLPRQTQVSQPQLAESVDDHLPDLPGCPILITGTYSDWMPNGREGGHKNQTQ